MGTRHLTAVYQNGEYKVAQYGQWDGYPDGQGLICLEFLRDKLAGNWSAFRDAVAKCRYISKEELGKLMKEYGEREDGSISIWDYDRFQKDYPALGRDMGSEVLEYMYNHPEGVL